MTSDDRGCEGRQDDERLDVNDIPSEEHPGTETAEVSRLSGFHKKRYKNSVFALPKTLFYQKINFQFSHVPAETLFL